MSTRKKRSDAGVPRKPAETMAETMCDWFAGLPRAERETVLRDLRTIQRYAPEIKQQQPAVALLDAQPEQEAIR